MRLVQIRNGYRGRVYDVFRKGGRARVKKALTEDLTDPVAHNAVFEREWIHKHFGLDLGAMHDTLVMSRVLYGGTNSAASPRFSHSLEAVAKRELGLELDKSQQASDWSAPVLTERRAQKKGGELEG